MKKLSTRTTHYEATDHCPEIWVETKRYRLSLEATRVAIISEHRVFGDGSAPEFRVDFHTGKTRYKDGGSHGWKNPVTAFRAISEAILQLYLDAPRGSRILIFAADDARFRVYRRIAVRFVRLRGYGSVLEYPSIDGDYPYLEVT